MPPPSPLPAHLYKILPTAPPSPLPPRLPLSDLDRTDGFIHLSTSSQVASTADKFFADATELWLLVCRYDVLARGTDGDASVKEEGEKKAEIRWEEVAGGCFAHFYGGDLGSGNVEGCKKLARKQTESWEAVVELEW